MKKISTLITTSALLAIALPALAAGPATLGATSATPTLMQRLEKAWNKMCDNLETRIDLRITRYENNTQRHEMMHQNLRDGVKKIIDRLDAKNIDTTKLTADLQELDSKIAKFGTDYAAYIDGLKATKSFACGESEGQFVKALGDANKMLATLQQDSLDIRLYYQKTIRPDFVAIKQQLDSSNK